MMRSGSTLQYNIVSEILKIADKGVALGWIHRDGFDELVSNCQVGKYNLFKNHFLTGDILKELEVKEGSKLLYVFRDIRDVCVSVMEKENKTFDQVFESGALQKAIEQYYIVKCAQIDKCIQSYEMMSLNAKKEIINIADYLHVELSENELDAIYNEVSFDAQSEKIKVYKKEKDYIIKNNQKLNSETRLHVNNIKDGKIGKYKTILNEEQIKALETEFGGWLIDNGYMLKTSELSVADEPFRRFYSQHGEDYLLSKFFDFKKNGVFVEVGAFDGVHLSNTYSFEREGWRGVCIEPGQYFRQCQNNRPKSICINAACVSSELIKDVTFYTEDVGLLSTLIMDDDKKEEIEKRYKKRDIEFTGVSERKVEAVTLNKVLDDNNIDHIDFVSIDVEGAELDVLNGFDLDKYTPDVLVIEANDEENKQKIIDFLTVENDYIFARELNVNLFFVSNTHDFYKLRNIDINCLIEKQLHPLGKEYTLKSCLSGMYIVNGEDLIAKNFENEKVIKNNDRFLEKMNSRLNKKNDELRRKREKVLEKSRVIENKNSQLGIKNNQIRDKLLVIEDLKKEIENYRDILRKKDEELDALNKKFDFIKESIESIIKVSIVKKPLLKASLYKDLMRRFKEISE